MAECRIEAARWLEERHPKPRSRLGAALIVAAWTAALSVVPWLAWGWWSG
jgi:hypothetical protein